MNAEAAEQALIQLLIAYAKSDEEFGSPGVEWEDLDEAFQLAKQALPGKYESIVVDLLAEQLNEDRLRIEGR